MKADSRAFAALMRHIREVDGQEHTVVLMQIENEPGLQGAAREHSDYAEPASCYTMHIPPHPAASAVRDPTHLRQTNNCPLDVLAPDIYVQDFCDVCDEYTKLGNPLIIPETAMHGHAGPRLVYVIGHYHAWGFSPFGFEDLGQPGFSGFTAKGATIQPFAMR